MEKTLTKKVLPTKRVAKSYFIEEGRLPKEIKGKLEIPFNYHTKVIGEAINSLVKRGKKVATREEITSLAKELGLYTKPSKSSPSYIFSWWLSSLKYLGYIKR